MMMTTMSWSEALIMYIFMVWFDLAVGAILTQFYELLMSQQHMNLIALLPTG